MTPLEDKLYVALLGARTIVAATANVNPAAFKILNLINSAAAAYKTEQGQTPIQEETADATRDTA